jgi:hypothetical protein
MVIAESDLLPVHVCFGVGNKICDFYFLSFSVTQELNLNYTTASVRNSGSCYTAIHKCGVCLCLDPVSKTYLKLTEYSLAFFYHQNMTVHYILAQFHHSYWFTVQEITCHPQHYL